MYRLHLPYGQMYNPGNTAGILVRPLGNVAIVATLSSGRSRKKFSMSGSRASHMEKKEEIGKAYTFM
ncbi:predicted protein [Sclerotinia sclerotiorum 1980 UF-70]|uniref:Uncharacterized protein n=1 Tax=Sclerotinia sclerotiorum (strain ATCC 18683 / 1980 / Ss-1) TaxID=665079 RepID=A7E483_SCLS1|nr:predicted protein [Sclerotinia sclerotiorum 1980 UF-70]EDN90705.1 predicted protein [Sclerotinia sclerotiorum 1980 UF-70]